MPEAQAPQDLQGNALIPPGLEPIVFDTFEGINTAASRPGIADQQMAWCDGWMPIGKNNLRVMPGVGDSIYTASSSLTVVWYQFGNIGSTPIAVVLLSDGSLIQVNTNTGATTQIAGAGTIQNPSVTNIGLSQWGNQYIVIVANQTNGFWLWDGTIFYSSGSLGPDVTLDNSGSGYTSQPSITAYGGEGGGATFTADIQNGNIANVTVTNPGSGYQVGDAVALAFSGGGSSGSTAILQATIDGGTVSGVNITNAGSGYTSAVSAQVLGGNGSGASVTVTITNGSVSAVSVVAAGSGYSQTPTIYLTDPNNPVAQATVDLMPFGVQGTTVETYTSRAWVGNGDQASYTAPDSVSDFDTGDGAGNFISRDSFLRRAFIAFKQSNGFLYLIADSSINYISGVTTSGSPAITTFTNQNADPEIGTPWAPTVDVFSRNILFANAFGIQVSYGGAVTKVSEVLDGIYNSVANFGGFIPSSAKAIIFGKRVWMVLLPVIDPITNQQVNKLFLWNGKIFWSSQQDVNLTFIASQEIDSVLTAYGTDGTSIYPLFQKASTGFTKTVQSKLFDRPGGYLLGKTVGRLWGLVNYYSTLSPELDITIDSENTPSPVTLAANNGGITWTNNVGGTITWTNSSGETLVWSAINQGVNVFPPQAVGQQGALVGMTISTNAADLALISMTLGVEPNSYRG